MWTERWRDLAIKSKPLVKDEAKLSTWCLSERESEMVLPKNLTGLSAIDGIDWILPSTVIYTDCQDFLCFFSAIWEIANFLLKLVQNRGTVTNE